MKKRLAALTISALALGACSGGGNSPSAPTASVEDQIIEGLDGVMPGLSALIEADLMLDLIDQVCGSTRGRADIEEFSYGFRAGLSQFDTETSDGILKVAVDAGCPHLWDRP